MGQPFVREFLQITKESAYLTPMASPVRGTDQIVIRLSSPGAFTPRPNPITVDIPFGGGFAMTANTVSDKTEIKGTLTTELCYSQVPILMGMGLTRINTLQTLPWVTTEPYYQFPSVTVDHALYNEDTGTYKRTRYLGVKCDGGKLDVSGESQKAMLTLNLVGSTYQGNTYDSSSDPDATAMPIPSDSDYVNDYILFIHSRGAVTVGSSFAQYQGLSFSWEAGHDMKYYASRFVQSLRSYGFKGSLEMDATLVSSPDYRADFQTLLPVTTSVAFTNGSHTLTLDMKTNPRVTGLQDNTPLEKIYGRKVTIGARYDPTNSAIFAYSFI